MINLTPDPARRHRAGMTRFEVVCLFVAAACCAALYTAIAFVLA